MYEMGKKGKRGACQKEADVNLRKLDREIKGHVRYEMRKLTV